MMKRPRIVTNIEEHFDEETAAFRNVWFETINRAIDDSTNDRYRKAVLNFFCSDSFAHLCQLLSLDSEAIRNKVVPVELRDQLLAEQAALAANPIPFKQHKPLSYFKRRKAKRKALLEEVERRRAQVSQESMAAAPTVPVPMPVAPAEPPAAVLVPVSLYDAYKGILALDIDAFETAIGGMMESNSLERWESLCTRMEVEKAIALQLVSEQTT